MSKKEDLKQQILDLTREYYREVHGQKKEFKQQILDLTREYYREVPKYIFS